ncbi:MAG: RDD family protein [Clostridia bacterium]|nr:RDD family protein [Clostridia bacterium]
MEVLRKRLIAFFFDALILGVFYSIFKRIFLWLNMEPNSISYFLFISPFFFKDIVFRNASVGKKIVGLAIYNKDGSIPNFKLLIKRSFLMTTIGYLYFCKGFFVDKKYYSALIEWEEKTFGTKVVNT